MARDLERGAPIVGADALPSQNDPYFWWRASQRTAAMAELVWDGKYDKEGKRVAGVSVALPFQTVEAVNESAQGRQTALDLFSSGRPSEWRNRLIWGDKKYVLPALVAEL